MSSYTFIQIILLIVGVVTLCWLYYSSSRDHGAWDYVIEQSQLEFIGRSDVIIITYVWRKWSVIYKDFAITSCVDEDVVSISERDKAQRFIDSQKQKITSQRGR